MGFHRIGVGIQPATTPQPEPAKEQPKTDEDAKTQEAPQPKKK